MEQLIRFPKRAMNPLYSRLAGSADRFFSERDPEISPLKNERERESERLSYT